MEGDDAGAEGSRKTKVEEKKSGVERLLGDVARGSGSGRPKSKEWPSSSSRVFVFYS